MVEIVVNASLGVGGGPTLPLGATVEVQSYVFATVELTAAGGSDPDSTVDLLPDGGSVALLAIRACDVKGNAADVAAELRAGTETASIDVSGAFLVANVDALAAIVATGPRTVVLTNAGTAAITVEVLAGHRA